MSTFSMYTVYFDEPCDDYSLYLAKYKVALGMDDEETINSLQNMMFELCKGALSRQDYAGGVYGLISMYEAALLSENDFARKKTGEFVARGFGALRGNEEQLRLLFKGVKEARGNYERTMAIRTKLAL